MTTSYLVEVDRKSVIKYDAIECNDINWIDKDAFIY